MGRHPVQDHSDPLLMQVVDQILEVLRRSKSACRGKVPGDLVTPRTKKWMFHHGKEFDVRESALADVIGQLRREFTIAERAEIVLRQPLPTPQVDFVD